MVQTASRPSPSPAPPPATVGDHVRTFLRGLGQTLITLGLVVVLFIVYEVWVTTWFAERNNDRNISALRHEYDTVLGLPGDANSSIPLGSSLGILYIPRLGRDYAEAIVQGSDVPNDEQLQQGTAHYGNTQLPGQKGNFAIAGHRVGKGNPFLDLDQVRSGDAVVVETRTTWYVYRVYGSPAGGNPQTDTPGVVHASGGRSFPLQGRQIIEPSDGDVLRPVPNHPDIPVSDATDAVMTMTTCHPKFTATHRMILFAKLAAAVPALGNTPTTKASQMPAAISKLYDQVKG